MINAFYGIKLNHTQGFTPQGQRVPLTLIHSLPLVIIGIKTKQKDGYNGLKVGFGSKKTSNLTKAEIGVYKKAGLEGNLPRFLREVKVNEDVLKNDQLKPGMQITIADVFSTGDMVVVTGISKGKGFQGVVRRHHFKGGPATHGQSDRERAPGAIGSGTTPGRIYKGKRMAGRMGNQTTAVKNLRVVSVDGDKNILTIKGLIPGGRNAVVMIEKIKN